MASPDKIYIDQIKLFNETIPRGQLLNRVIAMAFALVMVCMANYQSRGNQGPQFF